MIEKLYSFTPSESKNIEKIINDDNIVINHMILAKGDIIPEHPSNSNVYLLVVKGNLTLKLEGQEEHTYVSGSIISYPYNIKMSISNQADNILEFFVIKAPNPKDIKI